MSNNTKLRRRIVRKRLSINFKRLILFYLVSISTVIIFSLLIKQILSKPSYQAKNTNSAPNPQVYTPQPNPQVYTPQPNPQVYTPQFNPQVYTSSTPNLVTTNRTNNNLGATVNISSNMRIIPETDYTEVGLTSISREDLTQFPRNHDQKLQNIVNDIVNYVTSKGASTEHLSISLVDLNSQTYAGYQDEVTRFPASVTKLFWMVYLYGTKPKLLEKPEIQKALNKMIQDSDNESASLIIDKTTITQSGDELTTEKFQEWYKKRLSMNHFFKEAGYQNINISQKLYPYSKVNGPAGRDLQIRKPDSDPLPIRNYTTTYNVARLLFQIETGESVDKKYSRDMKNLLERSLKKEEWEKIEFNHIAGFFGEGLPEDAQLFSKMGWNFQTRNDAAIIVSPDGKAKYILVVFGDHPSFYKDKKILPEISRKVYDDMTTSY
ncbi:serine hydrolase [Anabaenopsis arnoldii]|uniref:Serine hydrolase n=1 Tax=Anabaenopsis arnoldii TaxID=2152938 RepID=A0ABT5AU82_9CYAN|nr:serine hydrolase [Anabaenopsis arnoldii]MDB9540881.1 serine hydrolase [Anabaenopsis arnoldii]MDH6093319.1 serine hydrolase [Anabaenopsis arnoldii]